MGLVRAIAAVVYMRTANYCGWSDLAHARNTHLPKKDAGKSIRFQNFPGEYAPGPPSACSVLLAKSLESAIFHFFAHFSAILCAIHTRVMPKLSSIYSD